jgi:hypothetical protein
MFYARFISEIKHSKLSNGRYFLFFSCPKDHPQKEYLVKQEIRVNIVGNIPFDMTEEQLIEIFKEVGRVKSFRYF